MVAGLCSAARFPIVSIAEQTYSSEKVPSAVLGVGHNYERQLRFTDREFKVSSGAQQTIAAAIISASPGS